MNEEYLNLQLSMEEADNQEKSSISKVLCTSCGCSVLIEPLNPPNISLCPSCGKELTRDHK